MVVHPGAQKGDLVVGGRVARGELAQVREHVLLGAPRRQIQWVAHAHVRGDRAE